MPTNLKHFVYFFPQKTDKRHVTKMKDWQYSVPKLSTCALGEGCISAVLQCAPSVHPSPAPELTCGGFSSHVPLGEKSPCVLWDQALRNRTLLPLEQSFESQPESLNRTLPGSLKILNKILVRGTTDFGGLIYLQSQPKWNLTVKILLQ